MTKFICISGLAGAGKDLSGSMMRNTLVDKGYSVLLTHFADLLKFICKDYFGWDGNKDEKGRTMLQYVGTDCVRKANPDYWVDFVTNIVSMFPDKWDYVIIPDFRFENELQQIKAAGYDAMHVGVIRSGAKSKLTKAQRNHESETSLNGVTPDVVIDNTTTTQHLYEQVVNLCNELLKKEG